MFMLHITLQNQGEFLGILTLGNIPTPISGWPVLAPLLPTPGLSAPQKMVLKLLPHMTGYLPPWATSSQATPQAARVM